MRHFLRGYDRSQKGHPPFLPLVIAALFLSGGCASPGRFSLFRIDIRTEKQYAGSAMLELAKQGRGASKDDAIKLDPASISAIANGFSLLGGVYEFGCWEWAAKQNTGDGK